MGNQEKREVGRKYRLDLLALTISGVALGISLYVLFVQQKKFEDLTYKHFRATWYAVSEASAWLQGNVISKEKKIFETYKSVNSDLIFDIFTQLHAVQTAIGDAKGNLESRYPQLQEDVEKRRLLGLINNYTERLIEAKLKPGEPGIPQLQLRLGMAYLKLGNYETAAENLKLDLEELKTIWGKE